MSGQFGVVFVLVIAAVVIIWMARDAVKKWKTDRPLPVDYDEDPKRCLYKTFIYVTAIDSQAESFSFVIPGWHKNAKITLPLRDLPKKLQGLVVSGKRLYARTNLGASDVEELWFEDWEEE